MCAGEGRRRGGRGGPGMERLVLGNRVGLDANSSHLERLMDRGQHFCTYPASLPPQSITRQSIKSSKKPRKALAKPLRVRCCFSVAAFICAPFFFFFRDRADLEWSDIKDCLILTKQPVPRLFKFSWLERHVPVRENAVLFAQRLRVSSSCSHCNKKTWKNTWLHFSWGSNVDDCGLKCWRNSSVICYFK